MDRWRDGLKRQDATRRAEARKNALVATWGKLALALLILVGIWFVWVDRPQDLAGEEAEPAPLPTAGASPDSDEALRLYDAGKFADALPLLLSRADQGDTEAQCKAGKILAEGRGGVAPDLIEGSKWLDLCGRDPRQDPNLRDDEAADILDRLIHEVGWDVVGEGKYRGFQWQQAYLNTQNGEPGSAAEQVLRDLPNLSPTEAFELGADLNAGRSYPVDFAKALEAFRHAADGGLTEAIFNVGLSYYAGKGVKPDPVEARRWLNRAADAGYAEAAFMLGVMAVRGHGMEANVDAALAYLDRADSLGHPQARLLREAVSAGVVPK
ncbi:tetratricopeptide repeat protein [Dongia sp.]|uniref:tetratricopeptide repeat protein n=1 Tax=Dongia sp. TaxID=1977262 RepID=UPI0035AEC79E